MHLPTKNMRRILHLAVPLMIANIAMIGMGIVDTMMAGQASAEDLAGLAIGGNIWLIFEMTMWGIICAITPRVARFYGAKDKKEIAEEARQGLILAACLGVIATVAILSIVPFVEGLGATDEATEVAIGYLNVIAFSLPISGVCWAVFAILEGHGMMRFVVLSSITAVILNIILDYIFVFGKLGMPAMGGVGCAWTTTVIYWIWGISALLYLAFQKKLRGYEVFSQWSGIVFKRWKAIFALGIPISLAILAEEGFFNVTTLMIAPLGTYSLGAHQITIQILAVTSMIGFGLGQATAIRVAQCVGKKSHQDMVDNLKAGLAMLIAFGVFSGCIIFFGKDILPQLFTQAPEVIMISTAIMMFAPFFILIDLFHIWSSQSLRGYEDTKVPMLLQVFSYWFIGFPMGYSLAMSTFWGQSYGIYGFWVGLVCGISVGGLLLSIRLFVKTKHVYSTLQRSS